MIWEQGILDDCHLGKTAKASSKARFAAFRCALHAASIEESKPREFRLDWNHQGASALIPHSSPGASGDKDLKTKGKRLVEQGSSGDQRRKARRATTTSGDSKPTNRSEATARKPNSSKRTKTPAVVDSVISTDGEEEDGEMYCKVVRSRNASTDKANIGFVRLKSRKRSTFSQLRGVIESDLVPDAIPSNWEWRFLVPNLGPLTIKQESKFGPLLPFLRKTTNPSELGDGTLKHPVEVELVEKHKH